jgi:peptidoglycan/xylan/chitin deacetylase (PgdA/CDA1 family)
LTILQQALLTQIASFFPDAVFYKQTTQRMVALTIDDIPTPNEPNDQSTHLILDAIATHNQSISNPTQKAKATFFVISNHMCHETQLLQTILAQDHEIGNHGSDDVLVAELYSEQFQQHLEQAHDCISRLCGKPLRWYRPGRAFYNQKMLEILKQTPEYEPRFALGSMIPLDTNSWSEHPQFTAWYMSQFIFPGSILVLHGGTATRSANTASALKSLLKTITEHNYRIVTLSELWDSPSKKLP